MEILKSIGESLHIDPQVVYAQILAFVVLIVLLVKFLYRPVQDILQVREDQIANSLSNAENERLQAEALRKDYEGHLANIADEARVKLEQAMKDAEAARQRLLTDTQNEIKELHVRSQAQLSLEHEQLRRELRSEMSDIAVSAATKALRTGLTPALQSAVVDQVISELDQPSQQSIM